MRTTRASRINSVSVGPRALRDLVAHPLRHIPVGVGEVPRQFRDGLAGRFHQPVGCQDGSERTLGEFVRLDLMPSDEPILENTPCSRIDTGGRSGQLSDATFPGPGRPFEQGRKCSASVAIIRRSSSAPVLGSPVAAKRRSPS